MSSIMTSAECGRVGGEIPHFRPFIPGQIDLGGLGKRRGGIRIRAACGGLNL